MPPRPDRLITPIAAVYVVVLALWAGGLVVLGAVVAPTVFGIVPAPTSADAMTVVFRKFDRIAITCSIIALVAEAAFSWRARGVRLRGTADIADPPKAGGAPLRGIADIAGCAAIVIAAVLAIVEGVHLSPGIQALHRDGAVRGFGAAGQELERLHRLAETSAKAELAFLLAALVLVVVRVGRSSRT